MDWIDVTVRSAGSRGSERPSPPQPSPILTRYSRSGKPVENASIELFNGRLRDECFNVHSFASLAEGQAIIEARQVDYNTSPPRLTWVPDSE